MSLVEPGDMPRSTCPAAMSDLLSETSDVGHSLSSLQSGSENSMAESSESPGALAESTWEGIPHYRLSKRTVRQLLRIHEEGDGDQIEQDYSEALQELQELNACSAALYKAVILLKRQMNSCNTQISRLEDELVCSRRECEQKTGPVRLSYRQAEVKLKKEAKALEDAQHQCLDDLTEIRGRLTRIEADTTTLRSKIDSSARNRAELDDVLSTIKQWAGETDDRLSRLEEDSAHLRSVLETVQDRLDQSLLDYQFPFAVSGTAETSSSALSASTVSVKRSSSRNSGEEGSSTSSPDASVVRDARDYEAPPAAPRHSSFRGEAPAPLSRGDVSSHASTSMVFLCMAIVFAHYLAHPLATMNVTGGGDNRRYTSFARTIRGLILHFARAVFELANALPWLIPCLIVSVLQDLSGSPKEAPHHVPESKHPIWEAASRRAHDAATPDW
ncbi:hypothetical protein BV20DRAFT_1057963 [Pilatotrama ljubarskyi]|nr:hypothetical protein BV20DRAFT_1057963 [Pilatotrama ljubarskyi]